MKKKCVFAFSKNCVALTGFLPNIHYIVPSKKNNYGQCSERNVSVKLVPGNQQYKTALSCILS